MKIGINLCLLCSFLISCSTVKKTRDISYSSRLKFIAEYDIPYNKLFQNTTVGGLSGIDYDPGNDFYYLISDDRSDSNPARFYTAKIFLSEKQINSVQFVSVTNLLDPNGKVYPNSK